MNRQQLEVAKTWFYQWFIICFSLAIFISIGVRFGIALTAAIVFLWLNIFMLHSDNLRQKSLLTTVDKKLCGGIQLLSEAVQLQSRSIQTVFNFLELSKNKNTDSNITLH